MLTWDEGNCQEALDPFRGDDSIRSLCHLLIHVVLITRDPDPLQILQDPFRLERAGYFPNVGFVRIPATLVEGPGIGDISHE